MLQERKPRLTYHNLGYTRKQINARVVELVGKDQLHVSVFNASSGSILLAILDRTRASDDLIVSEPLVIDDVTIHCYGLVTNDPEMFDTAIIDNLEDVDQNTKEFRYNGFTMLKQKGKHKELDRYRSTTIDIKIQQFHMRVPDDWHEKMSFRIEDIIKTPPIKIDLSMLEFMDSINAVLVSEHSTEIKKIDNLVYKSLNIRNQFPEYWMYIYPRLLEIYPNDLLEIFDYMASPGKLVMQKSIKLFSDIIKISYDSSEG